MNKTLLLSVLTSTLIMAGGDITPVEPMIQTPVVEEVTNSFNPAIALIGGVMKGDGDDTDWEGIYGAEFSFNCLFSDAIRQQIQVTNYDEDGIKMLQANINPHYMFDVTPSTQFGFGPTLGFAKVEIGNQDDTVFTYGVGASIRTNISSHFFVGAEAKYEWTDDAEFYGIEDNLDNAKVFAKIGYQF